MGRLKYLGFLLTAIFLMVTPASAYALAGINLGGVTNTVSSTVNQVTQATPLPVQVQLPPVSFPTLPPVDLNPAVQPVTQTVNSLPLPVDVPPISVPELPTIPGIDTNTVVDNTVNTVNGLLPLQLPTPSDILSGINPSNPQSPSASGVTPTGSASQNGPGWSPAPINLTPAQLSAVVRSQSPALLAIGQFFNQASQAIQHPVLLRVSPADAPGFSLPGLLKDFTSLIPFVGVILSLVLIAAFFKTAQNIRHSHA